jgi:hypothetical protein
MTFWYGSGSPDPYPLTNGSWFGSGSGSCYFSKDANKKKFSKFFFEATITSFFGKIKSHKEVTKQ